MTAWPRRPLAWSFAIALVALAGRARLADFPPGWHYDEEIVARLVERNLRQDDGRGLSVNWANVPGRWWTRNTVQFSPFTLLETAIAGGVASGLGRVPDVAELIRTCRGLSVVSGALAGVALFLFTRDLTGSAGAGLLAQALWSASPLSLQDSLYARVDAFLGLLVNLTLWLGLWALRAAPDRRAARLALVAGVAGLTLATKWNAFVAPAAWAAALLLAPGETGRRKLRLFGAGAAVMVAAFLAATPELLLGLRPLLDGLAWELAHYAEGHPPHQAYDAADGNLVYWSSYFLWIGLGPAAVAGVVLGALDRAAERSALLFFRGLLGLAVLSAALPRTRFERNWEVALGLLCAAAAIGVARLNGWAWRRLSAGPARAAAWAALAVLLTAQPALTSWRFSRLLDPQTTALYRVQRDPRNGGSQMAFATAAAEPESRWDGASPLALFDYGDPHSRAGLLRWRAYARGCEMTRYDSDWSGYDYPFSTIDMYHGPRRVWVLRPCALARPPMR